MKWLSAVLALIALFFAGTTIYFARELQQERASQDSAVVPSTSPETAAVARTPPSAPTSGPSISYPVTTNGGQASDSPEEELKQLAIAESREFLVQLADPVGRARLLEEHKLVIRARQGVADYLRMDADEYSRFIDLLAMQELGLREAATHCILDQSCKYTGHSREMIEAHNREIASAFGAETAERYRYFQSTTNERKVVAELRGRLPDGARLSDAKSEELVKAWVDESARIREDMEAVGHGISMSGSMAFVVMDPDAEGRRAAAAADFNRRWHERAASVLTREQLAVYTRLQNKAVEQSRAFEELRRASN